MSALRHSKHILVLYDQQHSHKEVPGGEGYRLSYCAAGDPHMDVIGMPDQGYDWLLVDGSLMGEDRKEFIHTLRAIDTFCAQGKRGCTAACRIEWTSNGVLQLSCCMQQMPSLTPVSEQSSAESAVDGFVFEYHAPMKNAG